MTHIAPQQCAQRMAAMQTNMPPATIAPHSGRIIAALSGGISDMTNGMLIIKIAASIASAAWKDSQHNQGSATHRALVVIANNLEIMETQQTSFAVFSVIEAQEAKAFKSLQLAGYLKDEA